MRQKSHELQWLEALYFRNGLSEKEIKHYQQLVRGYLGEVEFDKYCQMFLGQDIPLLDDITLKYQYDHVQIDKMMLVSKTLYVIDMKYYRGSYVFENNEWRVGQKLLSHNIYEQLRRAIRVIQNIVYEANLDIDVQGVLAFMNPEASIEIKDTVQEETLAFHEIPGWLIKLNSRSLTKENYKWENVLLSHRVENFRTRKICDLTHFNQLKKGIGCTQCGKFNMKEKYYILTCSCGHEEVKETAFVRTICEGGLILHQQNLKKKNLGILFGQNYNLKYLEYILNKHFVIMNRNSQLSSYQNKGVNFEEWFKDQKEYFESIENRKNWNRKKESE